MSDAVKLTDAQQQATGPASLTRNVALLSGAGCGKTFVLARRFTELLMQAIVDGRVENPLAALVALTFTDKAATEMRQRIRRFLRARLAAAESEVDRRLLLQFIEALPDARISTIHSFCAALLRGHAIEAGLDPDFSVAAEQIVTQRMLTDAAEQAVLAAVEDGDADVASLLAGVGFSALVDEVRQLVGTRERIDLDAPFEPSQTLQRWQVALDDARQQAEQRIADSVEFADAIDALAAYECCDPTDTLLPHYEAVLAAARHLRQSGFADADEAVAVLSEVKPGTAGRKKAWGVNAKDVRDAMKAVAATIADELIVAPPLNDHDTRAAEVLAVLVRLARDARDRYAEEKRASGLVDFSDLIVATRDLLATSPALAARIGRGIGQLLIDEAQDTDATQVGLLLGLLGGDGEIAGIEDGKLFLVGDAKQSIYRFRGAQVEIFAGLCDELGKDRQIDLATSFRTHAGGVAFVNHVFGRLLGEDYSPIEAHRQDSPPAPTVEILLAHPDETRDSNARQASVAAEQIKTMIEAKRPVWDGDLDAWRPVEPRDIAILLSRMPVSGHYERELGKRNIDYYVVAGSGFFRQQEVFDILNALRVIDNPRNDIAFFGLLRSMMVGLDDNALMHIAATHTRPYLPALDVELLAERLTDSQRGAVASTVDLLRSLGRVKDALPISEIVDRLLVATGYEAVLLAQWKGKRMAGNVRQLHTQARAADGQISLAHFIEQMDDFTLNSERYEQANTSGEADNVVRLMTIHKAKGLEFPVVVAPDLNFRPRGHRRRTLYRLDWGLTTALQASDEEDDGDTVDESAEGRSHVIASALENRDILRETLRQYYVALTRHRDYLILVGDNDRLKAGRPFRGGQHCFLNQLDGILDLCGAVAAPGEQASLALGSDDEYEAAVRVVTPPAMPYASQDSAPGATLLSRATDGASLCELLGDATGGHGELPLVGPLSPETGSVELAATALAEFEACPALYRWRYELRGPTWLPTTPDATAVDDNAAELDAMTFGTLLHRCMELLDVHRPASAETLVRQAAADLDLDNARAIEPAAKQFAPMLERFLDSDLAGWLRCADAVHRELDFVASAGPATVRGQIDLLYRTDGAWHVVDYKSDRVHGDPKAKLDTYRLQLLIYAHAVRRFTGEADAPADASLYFLPAGDLAVVELDAPALAEAEQRLAFVASQLIAARRSGRFPRCGSARCDLCRQERLCNVHFA
ncbi:MAG: UvrD-helicase domain-containing protein [Planctomycetes bacterium]|jgi:ATP-dependent helicase/nuclease subunit A|nr:UvrD-helicase domain-containing protein [Planctomycetota bacterium]